MVPEELTDAVQKVVNRVGLGHLSVHTQYALRETYCVCTVIVDRKDKRMVQVVCDALSNKFGAMQVTRHDDGKVIVRMPSNVGINLFR